MSAALAKIHIAKKELALHDDDYRALLLRETGQDTAKGLSDAQTGRVLEAFKTLGWKPRLVTNNKTAGKSEGPKTASSPAARKARALWLSLWRLGVIRNKSEVSLEAFGARQLGVEKLQWADDGHMYKLIEALKSMAERNGWVQDVWPAKGETALKRLKRNLIIAQYARLNVPAPPTAHLDRQTFDELSELSIDLSRDIHSRLTAGT